ncbi:hypothetical protein [Oceanobacillus sp. CAU 1775]
MGIYLGITFNREAYPETKKKLEEHAKYFNKALEMKLLVDLSKLEHYFTSTDCTNIDRVILYDYDELGCLENFREFSTLCMQHKLEYSLIKKSVDLHSDVDTSLMYLFSIA